MREFDIEFTVHQQNAFGEWRSMIIEHDSNRESFVRNLPQFHRG